MPWATPRHDKPTVPAVPAQRAQLGPFDSGDRGPRLAEGWSGQDRVRDLPPAPFVVDGDCETPVDLIDTLTHRTPAEGRGPVREVASRVPSASAESSASSRRPGSDGWTFLSAGAAMLVFLVTFGPDSDDARSSQNLPLDGRTRDSAPESDRVRGGGSQPRPRYLARAGRDEVLGLGSRLDAPEQPIQRDGASAYREGTDMHVEAQVFVGRPRGEVFEYIARRNSCQGTCPKGNAPAMRTCTSTPSSGDPVAPWEWAREPRSSRSSSAPRAGRHGVAPQG